MLLRFKVGNFLSFDEVQTFDMIPTDECNHKGHVMEFGKENILLFALLYGANASGKTNLFNAFQYAHSTVIWKDNDEIARHLPKYQNRDLSNNDNEKNDSFFEFEFVAGDRYYTFGFTIITVTGQIIKEYAYVNNDRVHSTIYECDHTTKEIHTKDPSIEKEFKSGRNGLLLKRITDDISKDCQTIRKCFDIRVVMDDEFSEGMDITLQSLDWLIVSLKRFIPSVKGLHFEGTSQSSPFSDTYLYEGIIDPYEMLTAKVVDLKTVLSIFEINIVSSKEGISIQVYDDKHLYCNNRLMVDYDGYSVPLEDESMGLIRVIKYLIILHRMIDKVDDSVGRIILIDEIERELHPLMTSRIIEMFFEMIKGHSIQLIATTHESILLDERKIRSDEVWFIESDPRSRRSKLYPLKAFRLNDSESYDFSYLMGRFGAIPRLGPSRGE